MTTRLMRGVLTVVSAAAAMLIGSAAEAQNGEPLRVVATTGMIADVAAGVAGDRADVETLMGPGVDPHLYKPTRSDVRRLMDADVIFYNGLLLEGQLTDALIRAATSGKKVFAVTEMLSDDDLLEPEELEGKFDPHVWMDVAAWSNTVAVVRDTLADIDPAGASEYEQNAAGYIERLLALDAYAERVLSTVPESRRVLVTAHDAFNYFGSRYGYEVVGIQGISTESEAGVRDIERLVDLLVERQIAAVFVESTVSDRNVKALIAGARARGHTVTIGGELFSDAMGDPGTYPGTYIGMIDHNVTTIARALGGTAPAGGLNGELETAAE
ncbi:MAG: zinc ABC transporter substrate-binding protein [Planctomycetota bacterium]